MMNTNVERGDTAVCVHVPPSHLSYSRLHLNIGGLCKVVRVLSHGPGHVLWDVECLTHWVATHPRNSDVEITIPPGGRIAVMDCHLRPLRFHTGRDETLEWGGYPPSPKLELDTNAVHLNRNLVAGDQNKPAPGRPFAQFSDKALRAIGKRLGFDPLS